MEEFALILFNIVVSGMWVLLYDKFLYRLFRKQRLQEEFSEKNLPEIIQEELTHVWRNRVDDLILYGYKETNPVNWAGSEKETLEQMVCFKLKKIRVEELNCNVQHVVIEINNLAGKSVAIKHIKDGKTNMLFDYKEFKLIKSSAKVVFVVDASNAPERYEIGYNSKTIVYTKPFGNTGVYDLRLK